MREDAGSAVSIRVEGGGLSVDLLGNVVVFTPGIVASFASAVRTKEFVVLELRVGYLHFHVVEHIVGSLVHGRGTLGPSVDILGSEVGLRASERKILVAGLSGEDLEHSVGVGISRNIYDLAGICGVFRSGVDLDFRHLRRT